MWGGAANLTPLRLPVAVPSTCISSATASARPPSPWYDSTPRIPHPAQLCREHVMNPQLSYCSRGTCNSSSVQYWLSSSGVR